MTGSGYGGGYRDSAGPYREPPTRERKPVPAWAAPLVVALGLVAIAIQAEHVWVQAAGVVTAVLAGAAALAVLVALVTFEAEAIGVAWTLGAPVGLCSGLVSHWCWIGTWPPHCLTICCVSGAVMAVGVATLTQADFR